jgi:hypothetical protein
MKVGDLVRVRKDDPCVGTLPDRNLVNGSIGIIIGFSMATLDENQLPIPDFPTWLIILSQGKQWTICETELAFI